jgi:hypothetical protein
MERPCYRCGANVDEGVSFCPQCNAPQIRVTAPAGEAESAERSAHSVSSQAADDLREPATGPLPPGTPGEVQPPATPVRTEEGFQHFSHLSPGSVDWPQAVPGAAIAGAVVALAWAVPFLSFFIWMGRLTGLAGVLLYRRRVPEANPTPGMGARIGALAGLFGFGVFVLLMALQMLVMRSSGQLRSLMQQVVQQAAAQNADPRAQEVLKRLTSPEGLAIMLTLVLVLAFFAFLMFSSLGGALGAYLVRRRR